MGLTIGDKFSASLECCPKLNMFIVPLSLFLISTYLRPRTQAELSYLITAVECLSGLWCLLFAPFQIQLSLVGLFLLLNTGSLKSILQKNQASKAGYLDLSDPSSPAIDIEAHPIAPLRLNSIPETENSLTSTTFQTINTTIVATNQQVSMAHQKTSSQQSGTAIAIVQPNKSQAQSPQDLSISPHPTVIPEQLVQMQYRGTTYFKSIPLQ